MSGDKTDIVGEMAVLIGDRGAHELVVGYAIGDVQNALRAVDKANFARLRGRFVANNFGS